MTNRKNALFRMLQGTRGFPVSRIWLLALLRKMALYVRSRCRRKQILVSVVCWCCSRHRWEEKNIVKKLFSGGKSYRGILFAFIAICIVLTFASPAFLTSKNILSVLRQIAVNSILAYGMTLVLLTGGIDLTVSSVVSLSSIICAKLIGEKGMYGLWLYLLWLWEHLQVR